MYRRWVLACTAGELVGIGAATAAALGVSWLIGEPRMTAARVGVLAVFALAGAIEGGSLAALQWRVLRDRRPRLRVGEWVSVTVAIAVAGWIAGMMPALFIDRAAEPQAEPGLWFVLVLSALAGAGAGVCFGGAQWFVLRRHARHAARWVWIHVPAWALAMSAIFLGASWPDSDSSGWLIAASGLAGGALGGLLLGVVTAPVAGGLQPWVDEKRWWLGGRICAVTGANSGIGQEVALGLARLGASVLLLCRRSAEGDRVRRWILSMHPAADVRVVACDMGNFASIRRAAAQILRDRARLDVLVHNAGATFPGRTLTDDGIEATLAVDVVGPFLLTMLMRERLERCGGRVVLLTGIYHRRGSVDLNDLHFASRPYNWVDANNQAQRGRWLFVSELARRAPRLMTAAVHPGAVLTGAQARLPRLARALMHTLARPAFVRAEVGAIPVLRLAADPDSPFPSGRFFDRCRLASDAANPVVAAAFWHACEAMTGERCDGPRADAGAAAGCDRLTPS